jgi:hypothetical protein
VNGFESPYLSPSNSFSVRVVLPEECLDDPLPPNDPLFKVGNIVETLKFGQLYSVVSIDTSEVMEEKNGKIDKSSRVFYIYGITPYMPGDRRMKKRKTTVGYWEFEKNLGLWIEPRRSAARIPSKKAARKTSIPTSHPLGCECTECAVIEEECTASETEPEL